MDVFEMHNAKRCVFLVRCTECTHLCINNVVPAILPAPLLGAVAAKVPVILSAPVLGAVTAKVLVILPAPVLAVVLAKFLVLMH